ncbi:unnamed protein product, partial [Closterium sp. Yama58-4]
MLSGDSSENPYFYSWNTVVVLYCDGGVFAGVKGKMLYDHSQPYYLSGRPILNSILGDLSNKGLQRADSILLTGCSAGAIAVSMACDAMAQFHFPHMAKVKCLMDAGFFMDISGQYSFRGIVQRMFRFHSMTAAADDDCRTAYWRSKELWRCFFPQYNLQYVSTPMFIVQSTPFTPQRGILRPLRDSQMAPFVAQSRQATILLLLLALAVARFPPLRVCAAAAPTTNDLREFRNDVDKKQNQISFLPREDYTSDTPTEREQNSCIQEKLQEASTEADTTIRGVKAANQGGEERVGKDSLRGKVRGNEVIWRVEGGGGWERVAPDMAAVVKMANDGDDSGGDSNAEDSNGGDCNDEDGNIEGLEEEGGGWGRVAPDMAAVVNMAKAEDDNSENDNGEDGNDKKGNSEKDNSERGNDEDKNGKKDSRGLRPETEILTVCTPAGHSEVQISPARMGQTWRGWGTSLGWFANYIGKLPPHQLSFLLDLLFHPSI